MKRGKQTCKILKEIRKQIAEENDIELVISECTYQGDCKGTCPKCEAEVRYLEHELEKRQSMGKAAVFAGMSIGTLLTAAACGSTADATKTTPNGPNGPEVTQSDTIIEEPPLMGIVAMYRMNYEFNAEDYQNLMKKKFVFPKMKNLSIVGGSIEYEKVAIGEVCDTFEKLVDAAEKFEAPYYPEGEQDLLSVISLQSKVDVSQYKGEMEVAFTVDKTGALSDIVIQKGIDKALDEAVSAVMGKMEWHPAICEMKDDMAMPFDCRCVQKIQFPIDIEDPIMLEGDVVPFNKD